MARQNRMTVLPEVWHCAARSEMVLAAVPAGSAATAAATRCSAGARLGMSARTCASKVSGVCAEASSDGRRRGGCGMASLYDAVSQHRTDHGMHLFAKSDHGVLRSAAEVHRVRSEER